DTATTEIYTLSLHDALPISLRGPAFAARSLSALEHKDTAFRPRSVRARHGAIGLFAFFRGCPKRHTSTKSTPTRTSTSTPTREAPPGSASSPNSGRPTRPNSRPRARTPVPAAGAQAQREVLDTQRNVLGSRRTNHAAESDGSSQSDARSAETKPPKSTATPGSARHQLASAMAPARQRFQRPPTKRPPPAIAASPPPKPLRAPYDAMAPKIGALYDSSACASRDAASATSPRNTPPTVPLISHPPASSTPGTASHSVASGTRGAAGTSSLPLRPPGTARRSR